MLPCTGSRRVTDHHYLRSSWDRVGDRAIERRLALRGGEVPENGCREKAPDVEFSLWRPSAPKDEKTNGYAESKSGH
jgi:hypothetical protein